MLGPRRPGGLRCLGLRPSRGDSTPRGTDLDDRYFPLESLLCLVALRPGCPRPLSGGGFDAPVQWQGRRAGASGDRRDRLRKVAEPGPAERGQGSGVDHRRARLQRPVRGRRREGFCSPLGFMATGPDGPLGEGGREGRAGVWSRREGLLNPRSGRVRWK